MCALIYSCEVQLQKHVFRTPRVTNKGYRMHNSDEISVPNCAFNNPRFVFTHVAWKLFLGKSKISNASSIGCESKMFYLFSCSF